MPWTVTVRSGSRVERTRHVERDEALDALQASAIQLARATPAKPVDLKYKQYAPEEQVSARIELAGPERLLPSVRAGIDIHGDGSSRAFIGRVRRQPVKARKGETAAQALRRELGARASR
jgi:hypothetical protein